MPRKVKKLFTMKASPIKATAKPTAELSDAASGFLQLPAEIRVKIYEEVIWSAEIDDDAGLVDSFWNSSEFTENGDYFDDSIAGMPNDQAMLDHISPAAVERVIDDGHTGSDGPGIANSFADILNLRLVCRRMTRELDHEIVQHTVSRVKHIISTTNKPLGYSSAVQNTPSNPFWDEQPLLVLDPEPKTYKDIQNIHLTTYASDIHHSGYLGNDEQIFLDSLAPHVRSLTLNMAVPEHVSAVSERHVRGVVSEGVGTLILHMFSALGNKAMQEQHSKNKPLPLGGVVQVRVHFPVGHAYARLGLWDYFVKVGGPMGLEMKQVKDKKGKVVGVVFAFAGVGKRAKRKVSKKKRVLGRVKRVWKMVTVGRSGR